MEKRSTRDLILSLCLEAEREGRRLTYRDIARETGTRSLSTVSYHLHRLHEEGLIRWPGDGASRRLRVRMQDGGELILMLNDKGIVAVDATNLHGLRARAAEWQFG